MWIQSKNRASPAFKCGKLPCNVSNPGPAYGNMEPMEYYTIYIIIMFYKQAWWK